MINTKSPTSLIISNLVEASKVLQNVVFSGRYEWSLLGVTSSSSSKAELGKLAQELKHKKTSVQAGVVDSSSYVGNDTKRAEVVSYLLPFCRLVESAINEYKEGSYDFYVLVQKPKK